VQSDGPTAGVDWASEMHVACVVGDGGGVIDRFDISHDATGLTEMARRFRAAGVQRVAIERGDGPVVEVLLDAALAVFVVPSRQIKSLRGRYGSAGNKMTGSTPMCSRTRCGLTVIGGERCGKIRTTPVRYARCVGPVRIWWRRGCRC